MKEKELAHVLRTSEHEAYIGILVVNDQREILLHQTSEWESPYLLTHNPTTTKPGEVAHHFFATLAIEADIHEAFISSPLSNSSNICHLIIALTSTQNTNLLKQKTAGACVSIDYLLYHVHDYPQKYANWLRESLDGVALYLKNLPKQSTLLAMQQQVELS